MYQQHNLFVSPPDSALLWRYMDLSKLIDILHRKCLFFTRADKLGDPWEGGTSYINIQQRPERYGSHGPDLRHLAESGGVSQFRESARKHTYISCWHENSVESAAMWKLYLKSDEGIALQTTFSRFKECFHREEKNGLHRQGSLLRPTTA